MGTVVSDPTLYYDEGRYYIASPLLLRQLRNMHTWGSVLKRVHCLCRLSEDEPSCIVLVLCDSCKRRSIEILAFMGKQGYLAFFLLSLSWYLVYMLVARIKYQ